jgi:hypothetical protein
MKRLSFVALALLAASMLGGRTSYLSGTHERHYQAAMHDSSITVATEFFAPCSVPLASSTTRCIASEGRSETLRQVTIVVVSTLGATEDCTFTIETSPDLSAWTAVASSAISVGPNSANAAGVCATGTDVKAVGDYCTRVLADGVIVEPGGGWRFATSKAAEETCSAMEGLGVHVLSVIQ